MVITEDLALTVVDSFRNSKNIEVGRVSEQDASWMSKLLDLDMVSFTGTCADCSRNFRSGKQTA